MWKCPNCGRSFSREGQSHFCGKIETIDQYIEEQDDTVKPYLNEVRQILHPALPETQESFTLLRQRNILGYIREGRPQQYLLTDWQVSM